MGAIINMQVTLVLIALACTCFFQISEVGAAKAEDKEALNFLLHQIGKHEKLPKDLEERNIADDKKAWNLIISDIGKEEDLPSDLKVRTYSMSEMQKRGFFSKIKEFAGKVYTKGKDFVKKLMPGLKEAAKHCAKKLLGMEDKREMSDDSAMKIREFIDDLDEVERDIDERGDSLETREEQTRFIGLVISGVLHVAKKCLPDTIRIIADHM